MVFLYKTIPYSGNIQSSSDGKIVITDEVEELVTHNIFYTAITRAREKLKIYWTPEVEEKITNRIRPQDISKDVGLLKNYLTEKQQENSFDFWL